MEKSGRGSSNIFRHFSGGNERKYENLGQDNGSSGWDFNPVPSEYKDGVISLDVRSKYVN
jgi:hypothetical protein